MALKSDYNSDTIWGSFYDVFNQIGLTLYKFVQ